MEWCEQVLCTEWGQGRYREHLQNQDCHSFYDGHEKGERFDRRSHMAQGKYTHLSGFANCQSGAVFRPKRSEVNRCSSHRRPPFELQKYIHCSQKCEEGCTSRVGSCHQVCTIEGDQELGHATLAGRCCINTSHVGYGAHSRFRSWVVTYHMLRGMIR